MKWCKLVTNITKRTEACNYERITYQVKTFIGFKMGVKRRASAAAAKAISGESKRAKPNAAKQRKSKDVSDDEGSEHQQNSSSEQSDLSSYEDEDIKSESDEDPSSEPEEEDSDAPKKKRRVSQAGTSASTKASKVLKKEAQRAGTTGLGPGTQVISKRPRARSPGDTPYQDDRIHMNTLLFLGDLGKNNNREWLKCKSDRYFVTAFHGWSEVNTSLMHINTAHDPDYRASFEDWKSYVDCLTEKITGIDELIPELPFKDLVCRPICTR